jgi:hypothetical protein
LEVVSGALPSNVNCVKFESVCGFVN